MEDHFGDYKVIKPLEEGPLGTLFLTEHKLLKSPYTVQVLPAVLSQDKGFIHRFKSEIALLAGLSHPHILKVHSLSFAEGRHFIVSDSLVDHAGEMTHLAHYLQNRQHDFTEDELLQIATQLASALDYAHRFPYAHMGMTLNNVFIKQEKGGIHVSLGDFGLARFSFLSNYPFLAPEQKLLDTQAQEGALADVYAFGVLLYYLIARTFPEGFFELPSSFCPYYAKNWDLLITRCLHHDRLRRPLYLQQALEETLSLPPSEEVSRWGALMGCSTLSIKPGKKEEQRLKPVLKPQEIVRPEFDPDPGAIFQAELSVAPYRPTQMTEIKEVAPLLTDMIVVEGGTFQRGSNCGGRDEMPCHAIHLSSFALDIHPVTNEQFVCFLEAMGGEKEGHNNDIIRLRESRIKRSAGKLSIESGYARHPVVGVTWYGAVAYAKWIGKRLPTEAEWEIAACGGTEGIIYPTGTDIERSQANYFSSDTTPVMSYPCNGYGVYDMAGNVYEWCQDWYDYHYYNTSVQEPNDPAGPLQGVYRILRGGCWKSLKEDLRCAHRHRNNPGTMNATYGFRCAADVRASP